MKLSNILGLTFLISSTAFAKTHTLHQSWSQNCGIHGKSIVTFNPIDTLLVTVDGKLRTGSWKEKRGKLYLKFDDEKKTQKWDIISLADHKYMITREDKHCVGTVAKNTPKPELAETKAMDKAAS